MKLLGRDRDAPPAPARAMETGVCPACDGRGGPVGGKCHVCDGSGKITFTPTFSKDDDDLLRELIEEGRPVPYAAIIVHRPLAQIHLRIALLRIESPRPEPDGFFHVRTRDGRDVDLHDPAFQETTP